MFKKIALAATLSAVLATPAFAADITSGWSGEAGLNASYTDGNTETTDIGGNLNLARQTGVWRNKFNANIDYGETGSNENKNRWALGYQLDRDLNERTYVFGSADYYDDQFGAYENGYFVGTGLGYKAILPAPISWNLEGGIGYRDQTVRNGDSEGEFALRGASDWDYDLNENVSLFNDTEITWSDSDTYIWNDIGLNAQLAGNLAARLSYRVDHHTDVPVGVEETDSALRMGIVYNIN